MSEPVRSEVFRLQLDVDEDMLRMLRATAEAEGVDEQAIFTRAVTLYEQLTRKRRGGDRMWVGQALLFAEEWRWR